LAAIFLSEWEGLTGFDRNPTQLEGIFYAQIKNSCQCPGKSMPTVTVGILSYLASILPYIQAVQE
jgi:hypothetical protein